MGLGDQAQRVYDPCSFAVVITTLEEAKNLLMCLKFGNKGTQFGDITNTSARVITKINPAPNGGVDRDIQHGQVYFGGDAKPFAFCNELVQIIVAHFVVRTGSQVLDECD